MRIALIEDNKEEAVHLQNLLHEIVKEYQIQIEEVDVFSDYESFLEKSKSRRYSILFLDIFLEHENGMDIARNLREKHMEMDIIFCTSSKEFAIEAYEVKAVHYLIKPIQKKKLAEALRRCRGFIDKSSPIIQLKQGRVTYHIPISAIRKVTSSNNVAVFDTYQGEFRTYETLRKVEQSLNSTAFLKIQRGILVNMKEIQSMNGTECTLSDGTIVCMSRRDKNAIREKYHRYLFQETLEENE